MSCQCFLILQLRESSDVVFTCLRKLRKTEPENTGGGGGALATCGLTIVSYVR